jgi:SAM-dependent methyltransferase
MMGRYVQANLLANLNQRRDSYISGSGATHKRYGQDVEASLGYINTVFEDYLRYGNVGPDELRGQMVLEIGPGDNLGVALRFISKGAAKVVCLDRFYSDRDMAQQLRIYQTLLATLSGEERRLAELALRFTNGGFEFDQTKIAYVSGVAVEDAQSVFEEESFDLIVSRAVLEHVSDLDQAFVNMSRWLKPGGLLLHKIDLRSHCMFPGHLNPLTFLTVPGFLWTLMVSNTGGPNRKRVNYYRDKLRELGCYDFDLYITRIVDGPEILPHKRSIRFGEDYDASHLGHVRRVRKRLDREFKSLSDKDLLIAGIFLRATKRVSL